MTSSLDCRFPPKYRFYKMFKASESLIHVIMLQNLFRAEWTFYNGPESPRRGIGPCGSDLGVPHRTVLRGTLQYRTVNVPCGSVLGSAWSFAPSTTLASPLVPFAADPSRENLTAVWFRAAYPGGSSATDSVSTCAVVNRLVQTQCCAHATANP